MRDLRRIGSRRRGALAAVRATLAEIAPIAREMHADDVPKRDIADAACIGRPTLNEILDGKH